MKLLFEWLFGERLANETARYLHDVAEAHVAASRRQADELLATLKRCSGPKIELGRMPWGEPVLVPVSDIIRAHGVVTGASGCGKTRKILNIAGGVLDSMLESLLAKACEPGGFGVLDNKSETYDGTLYLLAGRIEKLQRTHPRAAHELRRKIVIIDFSSRDPITPYNIFARWPGVDPDFFAANRADILMDLMPGADRPSLAASGVLKKLVRLMSESGEPITKLADVVENDVLRAKLVANCSDRSLAAYFTRQFPQVPRPTLSALLRRIDALFAAESVRLALGGTSAPDFRRLQDEGAIVLVNCFGTSIARSVRRVLQKLVFSDVTQGAFARQKTDVPFLWLCDEAQNFFHTESLRENITDLLTMARSFGSFFVFITQNATSAVNDARLLRVLHTNTRWAFAMRGDPADAAFLKPALPITGRRLRPTSHAFAPPTLYLPAEERALVHEEIASLPDREGYLWLKNRSAEAIRVRVADVPIPDGRALLAATAAIRHDATIGGRMSRKEYEKAIAARDREEEAPDLTAALRERYQSVREAGA